MSSLRRTAPLLLALAFPPILALAPACSSSPATGTGGSGTTSTSTATTGAGGGGAPPVTTTSTSVTSGMAVSVGAGGDMPLPPTFQVSGIVTDGKDPVEGAIVMQAGGKPDFLTGPDGAYTIELTTSIPGTPAVVAAKVGYRTAGLEIFTLPDGPIDLAMRFVTPPDNPATYIYGDPGNGDPAHDKNTTFCGHCHTTQAKQFQTSGHADAAKNELVQDLYAGVASGFATQADCENAGGSWRKGIVPGTVSDAAFKCYRGAGVLPDLNPSCAGGAIACDDPALDPAKKPTAFGRCADCHAAGIDGPAGGRNLHEAVGPSYESGNHCDVCHHIRDVDLTKPPGTGGALVMQRSRDHLTEMPASQLVQVLFGPLPDVPNSFMGGSYQPLFTKAEFCAGCHEQLQEAMLPGASLDPLRWPSGLPTYSTYSEWKGSLFNMAGTPCQFCHMPPDNTGLKNSLDVTDETNASITFGYLRTPDQLKMHVFREPLDGMPRMIDSAVKLSLVAASDGSAINVGAKVQNLGAGHAIPTGEPMRSLLLVVNVDACGQTVLPSGGMTLDDWGGAIAEGTVGADASINGAAITWPEGAALAVPGQVLRAVRPTGMYEDYPGIGFFADPQLSPMEKGIEVRSPLGEAKVVSAAGNVITLDHPLPVELGDQLYLGEGLMFPPADGANSAALAGLAGHSFARTLLDPQGHRGVFHHRAVDMQSDNRIGPGAEANTQHQFPIVPGCASATVSAALIYRPVPLQLARERGISAQDYVISQAQKVVPLP
ncbi:MAG: multiheme c-type cytochrome [Byssovorax sp.]